MQADKAIVVLAQSIVKVQQERASASARLATINAEAAKLAQTLANCDTAQAKAQREMDRLAAER